MKNLLGLFAVLVLLSQLSLAQKFPLRISVMTSRWDGAGPIKHGSGKANVQDGDSFSAVDFTYDCKVPFLAMGMNKAYPAAWKQKGSVMVLSLTHVQQPGKSECELHVTPVEGLYAEKDGRLVRVSKEEFEEFQEKIEKEEKSDLDRTRKNYPLRVLLFDPKWEKVGNMRMAVGKGNVRDGDVKRGFVFNAKCPAPTIQNLSSEEYWAQWAKKDSILFISAPPAGDADVAYCPVNVTMQPLPFKKNADGKVVPDIPKTAAKKATTSKANPTAK